MPEYCKINHRRKITESVLTCWWNNGSGDADCVTEHVIAVTARWAQGMRCLGTVAARFCFLPESLHPIPSSQRKEGAAGKWENFSGTAFVFLVSKEIVIECWRHISAWFSCYWCNWNHYLVTFPNTILGNGPDFLLPSYFYTSSNGVLSGRKLPL